ncbi:hypothetical protein ACPPVV_09605 [Rhodanobacter sp. Col0626]|uniref:hypothetical protein n=1 Tax=Rhodanobacter sp. Col0626 TaxID=3415679 RepID=UPI003CE8DE0D
MTINFGDRDEILSIRRYKADLCIPFVDPLPPTDNVRTTVTAFILEAYAEFQATGEAIRLNENQLAGKWIAKEKSVHQALEKRTSSATRSLPLRISAGASMDFNPMTYFPTAAT